VANAFTEANLETAMCLWEAALELRDQMPAMDEAWEEAGTSAFRHRIIAMVPACEAAWEADRKAGTEQVPYDWEHCPAFLRQQFADDSDLAEAAAGETCTACGRASIECSRAPCPAVIADRGDD